MKSFRDMDAWKIGLELLQEVHTLTMRFPQSEEYELKSQLRRSTKSILANLAEGFSRITPKDKIHKYTISRGECTETVAHLLMSTAVNYLSRDLIQKAMGLADREGRLLSGLIYAQEQRLKTMIKNKRKPVPQLPISPVPSPQISR